MTYFERIQIFMISTGLVIMMMMPAGFCFGQDNNEQWNLEKEKEGIAVYTRKIEGYQIKETKVEATVGIPISRLYQTLLDFDKQKEWMVNFSESELLYTDDSTEYVYYIRIDAPWPITDRDLVIKGVLEYSSDSLIVFGNSKTEGYKEEQKRCIRIPMMMGEWRFIKIDESTTKVINKAHGDPGGMIPSWIVNMKMVSDPMKSMKNFITIARSAVD